LLIQAASATQAAKLLEANTLGGKLAVSCEAHKCLNFKKMIIHCPELDLVSLDEITEELSVLSYSGSSEGGADREARPTFPHPLPSEANSTLHPYILPTLRRPRYFYSQKPSLSPTNSQTPTNIPPNSYKPPQNTPTTLHNQRKNLSGNSSSTTPFQAPSPILPN
jgi:hypothetical protein